MRINKVNPRKTLATALRLSRALKQAKLMRNKQPNSKHKLIAKSNIKDSNHHREIDE